MGKIAFVFPGQGSQFVGMARDLYDNLPEVKELYHLANQILGFKLTELTFEGPEEELKQTKVTQPAIFVHSFATAEVLQTRGVRPTMTAGHSLGEYSALLVAGAFSFEVGLQLVKLRAELMQKAGEIQRGSMAAIIGLDPETLQTVCEEASEAGVVRVANYNSPIQSVVSGTEAGVTQAMNLAKERGARKVVPLVVSGAFHSPLMEHALDGLANALEEFEITNAKIPVYSNVHARAVTDADEIRECLKQQLTNPVLWVNCIENMITDGADEFYEVGPGNVLTGLLKRINRQIPAKAIGNLENLEGI